MAKHPGCVSKLAVLGEYAYRRRPGLAAWLVWRCGRSRNRGGLLLARMPAAGGKYECKWVSRSELVARAVCIESVLVNAFFDKEQKLNIPAPDDHF